MIRGDNDYGIRVRSIHDQTLSQKQKISRHETLGRLKFWLELLKSRTKQRFTNITNTRQYIKDIHV